MASRDLPPRMIVPPAGAKTTCPARILPGSLHLFTHPIQQITEPLRAHFTRRYSRPGPFGAALFLFDALAAAGLVAFAVIAFSLALRPPTPLRVSIEASAPQVRAADAVGFSIRYENRGKEPLTDASLALSYPDAFRVTTLTTESGDVGIEPLADDRVIPLGTIGPGGNGTVRVAGYLLQSEKTTSDLQLTATLTGTQKDKQTVQSVSEAVVRVSGSALRLRWAGVPRELNMRAAVEGRPIWQTLALENNGEATLSDLTFEPFLGISTTAFEHRPISIGPRETLVLGEYDSGEWLMDIVELLSGKMVPVVSVDYQEKFEGTGGPLIEILSAELFDGTGIDVHARISSTGPSLDRGTWRLFPQPWSAVDASMLLADAEAEGIPAGSFTVASSTPTEIAFRIPLQADADTSALTMRAVASACLAATDQCAWSSSERVAVQAAAPTLAAELRYYTEEGEQLGRGPLPPRVAEKTEYWVVVRAEPGLITQDTELRVDLGSNVTYADKFSASVSGLPRQAGNTLVWRPDVIAGDGAFTFAAALAFRPTADQVDAKAVIVRSLRLLGKDASGAQTEATTGYLSTDVPADSRAAEKGTRVGKALE